MRQALGTATTPWPPRLILPHPHLGQGGGSALGSTRKQFMTGCTVNTYILVH